MQWSRETLHIADDTIRFYRAHEIAGLPELAVYRLLSSMMRDDLTMASESMGPDNAVYEKILDSIIRYFKRLDGDDATEMKYAIKEGVLSYYETTMQKLLDDRREIALDKTPSAEDNCNTHRL